MRKTLQASEAKATFLRVLDDVESGQVVGITRHGKQVAYVVPAAHIDRDRAKRAFQNIRAVRALNQPVTAEEILSARDEGRR